MPVWATDKDSGALVMRPNRLARKTHLKNDASNDAAVFDLTERPCADASLSLASLRPGIHINAESIEALPEVFGDQQDVLEWCAALFMESPTAGALWQAAEREGWSVVFDDLKSGGFVLDMRGRRIVIDHFALSPAALGRSAWFRYALLITFVRALRDIWHEGRQGSYEGLYMPEDVLMLERLRAADCDTVALLVGWELRSAGFADVWRHMIGAAEGDMAMVFTRHLERDPAAFFDGSALAYAFRQWYADEARVNAVDHETLDVLDNAIAESGAAFGTGKLSATAIEALSELPCGIGYLCGLGATVRSDPFFAGLHDPINQTHLFHLIYDAEVVMVNNVPFRDRRLARMIFPDSMVKSDV